MQKIVVALKELHDLYREPVSNDQLALIVRNLSHFDEAVVLKAIKNIKFTRTSPFPPKWPDFIAEIKSALAEEYPTPEGAWGQVIAKASRGDKGYAELDEVVKRVVDKACGWKALKAADNLLYYRNAFISTYEKEIERIIECQLKP